MRSAAACAEARGCAPHVAPARRCAPRHTHRHSSDVACARALVPQDAPVWTPRRCSTCRPPSRRPGEGALAATVSTDTSTLLVADSRPLETQQVSIKPEPAVPYSQWLSPEDLACCEPESAPLRVAVLLSGGVDSSLALNLACGAGHTVTAFYLQIWFQEDFANFWDACPWEEDLAYARAVCDQAGVQLKVVPLTAQYWERVVSACVADIAAGRTPNPDVLCNSRIKFGAFLEYLEGEHGGSFDRVASGHYARVARHSGPEGATLPPVLTACSDAVKDQTYFLAALTAKQLGKAMFPLGLLPKAAVRQLAQAGRLPPAQRKDSQGICFLGKVKFSDFVGRHLGSCAGSLVDGDSCRRVGTHAGCWFYTLGQRKGIQLSGGPWYVTAKDPGRNLVYVSATYHAPHKRRTTFRLGAFSWLGHARPGQGPHAGLRVKVRHGPDTYGASLVWETPGEVEEALRGAAQRLDDLYAAVTPQRHDPPPHIQAHGGGPVSVQAAVAAASGAADAAAVAAGWGGLTAIVELDASDQGLAAGQYAVLYDANGACYGCGVILPGADGQ